MDVFYIGLAAFFFFFIGAVFGSFFNVLIMRLPQERDVVKDRSCCDTCHTVLKWYDLIPVVSFSLLRGKCRYCGAKIPPSHFLMELMTGGLFLTAFLLYGRTGDYLLTAGYIVFWSMLLVVAVMDLREGIVMDILVASFAIILLVLQLFDGVSIKTILIGALTGFIFYFLVYVVTYFILRKEGFGQGDIVFLTGIGVYLGMSKTILVGFCAFYIALFLIIVIMMTRRLKNKHNPTAATDKTETHEKKEAKTITEDTEGSRDSEKQTDSLRQSDSGEQEESKAPEGPEDPEDEEESEGLAKIPFAPPMAIAAFIISIYGERMLDWLYHYIYRS